MLLIWKAPSLSAFLYRIRRLCPFEVHSRYLLFEASSCRLPWLLSFAPPYCSSICEGLAVFPVTIWSLFTAYSLQQVGARVRCADIPLRLFVSPGDGDRFGFTPIYTHQYLSDCTLWTNVQHNRGLYYERTYLIFRICFESAPSQHQVEVNSPNRSCQNKNFRFGWWS